MTLKPAASYAAALKSLLPKQVFQPARSRLLWLPFHLTVITLSMLAMSNEWLPGWASFATVPIIGFSFAGITFLAHETLHGAVVRGRLLTRVVGFIGFLPFLVSPRLWIRWHNQVHHSHANQGAADPDAFPSFVQYEQSRKVRWVIDHFSVGRKKLWGILTLLVGFSFHSAHILLTARTRGMLSRREHRLALLETGLGAAIWTTVLVLTGPMTFLVVYVLPVMVANSIVMAYILTNHSLSPQTRVNDPLVNSLSVTVPRFVDWLTLHFGFHVEHHVFPWMSTRHARTVSELIKELWPERYQSMPLAKALWQLHRTSRVYLNDTTLVDPHTGKQWQTLSPREYAHATTSLDSGLLRS